jgi:hypothetical protein
MGQAFLQEDERRENYDHSIVSVSPYAYLKRGRYIEYIEMWENYFDADQIHIVIHEKLINSDQPLKDLYSFLGVDTGFSPSVLHTVINANENKPQENPAPDLKKYLQAYFEEPNARLSKRLDDPLTEWQST